MTTFAHHRTSEAPTPATPGLPAVKRLARSAVTGAALLADSFLFARDMQSARPGRAARGARPLRRLSRTASGHLDVKAT